ncbi:MAG: hypothetical protein EBV86_04385 [Marivivens sp.]|nr:hypothetical protein [Marivivens sp.]
MEMFNKKELDNRIGPLKKEKKLYELENIEGYVIRKCSEYGLESSYDVLAEEMPYFKTIGYTEFATSFYMQPLNFKLRNEQLADAYNDGCTKCKTLDYSSYLVENIQKNVANKYMDRKQDFDKYPPKDYLVVLPGSNKVKTNVCLNRLRHIKRKHGDNVYFKPHPITTHQIIGELKDFFGEQCILPRDIDMYYYMQKAKTIYTTHISESAVYACVLGKKIEPIDVWNNIQMGSFYTINNYLFAHTGDKREFINKSFSNYKSGIINPWLDEDWRHKVDRYMDYISRKRHLYKDWFIADNPKKK